MVSAALFWDFLVLYVNLSNETCILKKYYSKFGYYLTPNSFAYSVKNYFLD